jgi:hypothetical protein
VIHMHVRVCEQLGAVEARPVLHLGEDGRTALSTARVSGDSVPRPRRYCFAYFSVLRCFGANGLKQART